MRTVRVLLALFIAIAMIPVNPALAASEKTASDKTEETKPVREVHNVVVKKKAYCFFVDHYVVLTPADVAGKTDSELTGEILKRAGLYMKEANCKATIHKVIKVEDWIKAGGSFSFSSEDLESIRQAEPSDGNPAKFSLDLRVSTETAKEKDEKVKADEHISEEPGEGEETGGEPGDDQEGEPAEDPEKDSDKDDADSIEWYTTFKRTSPRLFFVVVATETDAAYGEDICELIIKEENKKKDSRRHRSGATDDGGEPEDILPEYRTISMVDRSGAPIEPTLEDGTPVTLEWIDPQKHSGDSNHDRRIVYAAAAAAAAALAAVTYLAVKRKKQQR